MDEKDWAEPVVEVLHTAYLLVWDALKIAALFGIARGLEAFLEYLHIKPIKISTSEIMAADIIQNFDYALLLIFLGMLLFRFLEPLKVLLGKGSK